MLVVDDDEALRLLLKGTLLSAGYGVIEASDGEEAVSRYQSEQPDLILLD